ncbi:DUF1552 domain-containing protein [Reichenbachiella sp. MALMAid0571]|uniref:DUF1552 domain-containing protein n=1 Tax=Reichenbachiella sp. MALMAid0571 TaxID=3143939 RepID=UPI0032DF0C60
MKKKWQISRRKMLKGMGACIALPYLEAMAIPRIPFGQSDNFPVRSAFLFMPNGVHPDKWTPEKYGTNFTLSPILQPLEAFQQELLILGELMNKNSTIEGVDGHYARTANILTSMPIEKTIGDNIHSGGVSIDQVIAGKIGHNTLFPSLEYGLDRIRTGVDTNVGYTQLYASSISWKTPTQPLSKEIDPRLAFERLFKNYIPGKKIQEDPWKKSILDMVMDDAQSLKNNLGRSDQDKLEEYLESIRSIEKRIVNEENKEKFEANITDDIKKELTRVDLRIEEYAEMYEGVDVTEKTRLMLDIMALAFWSDASRVSTFMFGNSVSGRNFSFLDGVSGGHHSISHHMNHPDKMEEYLKINIWHIEQYAYFLDKLKSIKEGDGNLLDNSMIMFASGLRDGNRHSPYNLPVLVAGKGGGKLKTGQNLQFNKNTPLANLYLSMLQSMNFDVNSFGDSTGILSEIHK